MLFQCSDIPGCEVVLHDTKNGACSVEESKQELNKDAGKQNETWEKILEISGKP